jgi:hypothetical protein
LIRYTNTVSMTVASSVLDAELSKADGSPNSRCICCPVVCSAKYLPYKRWEKVRIGTLGFLGTGRQNMDTLLNDAQIPRRTLT